MTQDVQKATLVEYSREIGPRIRVILRQKEVVKALVETDKDAQEALAKIKAIREDVKAILEKNDDYREARDELKSLEKELKTAIKGAARGTKYKPAEMKSFFIARNKPSKPVDGVTKVVVKGETFAELKSELAA